MAYPSMVVRDLSSEYVDAGATFVKELDAAGIPVTAAFWLFDEESLWRLIIASPEMAQLGPLTFYTKVVHVLAAQPEPELDSTNVTAVTPDDPRLVALRRLVKPEPGLARIRFAGHAANGVWIQDALIYRLT